MNPFTFGRFLATLFPMGGSAKRDRPLRAPRPCLVCQVPHRNNNCFCSVECCEKHKAAKRASRA